MQAVIVTIRSRRHKVTADVEGFAPDAACPLAVVPWHVWSNAKRAWEIGRGWCIVHRPTGYDLNGKTWPTRSEAEAVLLACDPAFPAWPLAKGEGDPATKACRAKFNWACNGN